MIDVFLYLSLWKDINTYSSLSRICILFTNLRKATNKKEKKRGKVKLVEFFFGGEKIIFCHNISHGTLHLA